MEYSFGDRVVYGGSQVCVVGEIEKKSFDGENFSDYVKLTPVDAPNSSYFVQCSRMAERVRPLLSKEEVLSFIDRMPSIEHEWISDRAKRRNEFADILRSDDYSQLIGMIKALSTERTKRRKQGKGLMSTDEKALETANKLLSQEFSYVLGIEAEELDSYIENRTGTVPEWKR